MADQSLLPEDNQSSFPTKESIIAKWKDKPREELEAAKAESDLYIKTLEAKLDSVSKDYIDVKEQQQTGLQLKELLDRLDNPNRQQEPNTNQNVQQPTGIKPEDVEAMIARKLTDHQQSIKQSENFSSMQAKLKQNFGDDYVSAYKQRLDTLGLTKEFADDLARNHPTVFMKTFGLDEQRQTNPQPLPRSSTRQASFAPSTPKRDWKFYEEMKKTNPRMYLDPKISLQMMDDAIALGADFGMPED